MDVHVAAVIAIVGGLIAAAESASALLAYLDGKKQRRLNDVTLALDMQRAATEWDVIALISKEPSDLSQAERQYLLGISERCGAMLSQLERERSGRRGVHMKEALKKTKEAVLRLELTVDDAPVQGQIPGSKNDVQDSLIKWATDFGMKQRDTTTAYTPLGADGGGSHLILLSPRGRYLLARFRIRDGGAYADNLREMGFNVTNYSKNGFYSLRLTDEDLTLRSSELQRIVKRTLEPSRPNA